MRGEAGVGWHGNGGVAQCSEDVPRRGDGEEERETGEGMKQTPAAPFACKDEEEADGGEEKEDGDEALGEHGAGDGAPHEVGPTARMQCRHIECAECSIDGECEEE